MSTKPHQNEAGGNQEREVNDVIEVPPVKSQSGGAEVDESDVTNYGEETVPDEESTADVNEEIDAEQEEGKNLETTKETDVVDGADEDSIEFETSGEIKPVEEDDAETYDTRAGHRLAMGDPRVLKTRTPGREKRYALVLVLDRSGSMREGSPPKIEVATQALTRFAFATEALGIDVGVIDFIHGRARLVKPFSVETRHVQAALLDTACGGGTPLADAIGLARQLVSARRDEPLVITVTDDEPRSVEAVIEQLRASAAPVCSLTIATDCAPGSLSPDASRLAPYYERQTAVYTPDRLDDRLDQFASLLAGL